MAADGTINYVESVKAAIERFQSEILEVAATDKALAYAQGDVAEVWHAETYNLDAVRQGHAASAVAPRETLAKGPDVVFGPGREDPVQLKYYADPEATARAVADQGYAGMTLLVPSDQLPHVQEWLLQRAEAVEFTNPDLSHRYSDAASRLCDHLNHDGSTSLDLTRAQAEDLVRDSADGRLDLEDLGLTTKHVIQLSDQVREVGSQALQAAAIATAIQLTGYIVAVIRRALDEGSLTTGDLTELTEGRTSAVAKSAFTGTVAGGLALAAAEGLLGEAASNLAPETISLLVVLAVNSAISAYRASTGSITWTEAARQMATNGTVLVGAAVGGALGTTVMPVIGTIIGSILGAALTRQTLHEAERAVMAIGICQGWTFFGLVQQDYRVPEEILTELGWDTIEWDQAETDTVELDTVEIDCVELNPVELDTVRYLRRGIIGVRRIGYLSTPGKAPAQN
ncbi:hypothetical protein [Thauera aminoaromatica]|uniref:Uncharacterized protein n=1 Tax=Thauera aminoaromatica TaxID=164330 RepID=A0A5C7T6V8_THASP|nr:hypothetical protein [Thauera aminoaromatica]TXH91457.1 MAG: hypothetical protein E6Q80_02665 [Thauera aminoaromatica]